MQLSCRRCGWEWVGPCWVIVPQELALWSTFWAFIIISSSFLKWRLLCSFIVLSAKEHTGWSHSIAYSLWVTPSVKAKYYNLLGWVVEGQALQAHYCFQAVVERYRPLNSLFDSPPLCMTSFIPVKHNYDRIVTTC